MKLPEQCRAMVLTGDRTFELQHLDMPQQLQPGQILVAVEGCGICGSDIEEFEGSLAKIGTVRYPVIPGHEPVGRIVRIDAATAQRRGLAVGDRVAIHGTQPCGICENCRRGMRCVDAFHYGFRSRDIGRGLWGGFAEFLLVEPNTRLYRLAPDLSIEDAVFFNPLAAGFDWVIQQGGTTIGDSVLILGPGQRGLSCVIAAQEAGARQIIVTGLTRDRAKLDIARQLGATHTLVVDDTDVVGAVLELTRGRGADRVIDTTPLVFQPVADAIAVVRRGGTVVLSGIKSDKNMPSFPLDDVMHKQLRVVGALASGEWAVEQAIAVIASGRYPLHLLHTHTLPFTAAEQAIGMLAGHIAGAVPIHITLVAMGRPLI